MGSGKCSIITTMGKGKYPLLPPSSNPAPKNYQSTSNDNVRDSDSSTVSSSASQQITGGLPEDFKVSHSVSFFLEDVCLFF